MPKTTVLIVEDDAGLREALVDTLLLADYQVVAADSAEQAIMLLSKQSVVKAHQGRINVENLADAGACFSIMLPRAFASDMVTADTQPEE